MALFFGVSKKSANGRHAIKKNALTDTINKIWNRNLYIFKRKFTKSEGSE
jgi:hypothetical protein